MKISCIIIATLLNSGYLAAQPGFILEKIVDGSHQYQKNTSPYQPAKVSHSGLKFYRGNGGLVNYDFDRLVDLRGTWKFEAGDDMQWSRPEFNDDNWRAIFVPSPWEDEGYPGYDGYGWYRREFELDHEADGRSIYLYLGYIDDIDEVYINGYLVGYSGSFPPETVERDYILRRYLIPSTCLNSSGINTIAVRVYDSRLAGGIIRGKIGLYSVRNEVKMDMDLSGMWKFRPGDRSRWSTVDFNDSNWDSIYVPATWETQGYPDTDGLAWYRRNFSLPPEQQSGDLVLVLGRIDDYDEVYFNGIPIGGSQVDRGAGLDDYEWVRLRVYIIPDEIINLGGENVIAIKVYDGFEKGGIYDGPIGLMTMTSYEKHQKQLHSSDPYRHKTSKNFIDYLYQLFWTDQD